MFKDVLRSFLYTIGRILAYLAFGALIALFAMNNTKAAAISDDNVSYVSLSNYNIPTWWSVSASATKQLVIKFAEVNPDYSYVVLDICTNGPLDQTYISNASKVSSWFNENSVVVYNSGKACKTQNGYNGTFKQLQLQVGKFTTNEEFAMFEVTSTLNLVNNWNYNVEYTFTDYSTFKDDYLTEIVNNQKQQDALDKTNENLDKIDDTLNSEDDDFNSKKCGIVCKLKGIGSGIINLPGKLISGLIDGIKSLFIPSDTEFITNFVGTIEDKLGFIAEVPIACINFILSLADATWDPFTSVTFPSFEFMGYKLWENIEIDLTAVINIFKPFKYLTDVGCVALCVVTLQRWRDSFTGGGD